MASKRSTSSAASESRAASRTSISAPVVHMNAAQARRQRCGIVRDHDVAGPQQIDESNCGARCGCGPRRPRAAASSRQSAEPACRQRSRCPPHARDRVARQADPQLHRRARLPRLPAASASRGRHPARPARASAYPCRLDRARAASRRATTSPRSRCASCERAQLCWHRMRPSVAYALTAASLETFSTTLPRPSRADAASEPSSAFVSRNGPSTFVTSARSKSSHSVSPSSASGVGPRSEALLTSTSRPPSTPVACNAMR